MKKITIILSCIVFLSSISILLPVIEAKAIVCKQTIWIACYKPDPRIAVVKRKTHKRSRSYDEKTRKRASAPKLIKNIIRVHKNPMNGKSYLENKQKILSEVKRIHKCYSVKVEKRKTLCLPPVTVRWFNY